jgi:Spy/CpxP family protein refolding chaperone
MGPGMMGGYGMGPGMMGGYGMGPIWALDLSDAQRAKITSIADALRKKHWAIMGQILDEQAKLRDLYAKSEPDPKAVGAVFADISKLHQAMLEAHVQAMNQARGVLTPEQKTELDNRRRHGWEAGSGNGG